MGLPHRPEMPGHVLEGSHCGGQALNQGDAVVAQMFEHFEPAIWLLEIRAIEPVKPAGVR